MWLLFFGVPVIQASPHLSELFWIAPTQHSHINPYLSAPNSNYIRYQREYDHVLESSDDELSSLFEIETDVLTSLISTNYEGLYLSSFLELKQSNSHFYQKNKRLHEGYEVVSAQDEFNYELSVVPNVGVGFAIYGDASSAFRGQSILIKPLSSTSLFIKNWRSSLIIDGSVMSESDVNEDVLSSDPKIRQTTLSTRIDLGCEFKGVGGQYVTKQVNFKIESGKNSEATCYEEQIMLKVDLFKEIAISGRYFMREKLRNLYGVQADSTSNGVGILDYKYQSRQLKLDYTPGQHSLSFFAQSLTLSASTLSIFDASYFGGYFSSSLLGDGIFRGRIDDVSVESYGLNYQFESSQGWQYKAGLSVAKIAFDVEYNYTIYAFPAGIFANVDSWIKAKEVWLEKLSLGTGYQWKNFRIDYRMEQLVDLFNNSEDTDSTPTNTTNPESNTNTSKVDLTLDSLPSGNTQYLTLTYYF